MPIPWNEDRAEDLPVIESNLDSLLVQIALEARERRAPSVEMAQGWHRRIYEGAVLPVHYYAGEFRDSDPEFPELIDYEVRIGPTLGVLAERVPEELERFEASLVRAVGLLDKVLPVGDSPRDREQLWSVLTLCAHVHGEWVRIHPFANGNGRTARLWANWSALRYGVPPFVRIKQRPAGDGYARAAASSMRGEHVPMAEEFARMLAEYVGELPRR